ncbi:MAG: transketolase [Candidatus Brocadiia bacterium]
MPDFEALERDCLWLRNEIVDIIYNAGSGHSGGSLSAVEIIWTLYSEILNVRPDDPRWPDRDRFILSKGHAAPALYITLAKKGFFPEEELKTLRRTGSILQGHPDMRKTPGVEMSTGSLGMGASVGVGMALAARLAGKDYRVYVLVGDGELQEGQNWEAFMAAAKWELSNLVVIVDRNHVQLDGTTDEIMPLLDVAAKIRSFGWDVRECDGHGCESVYDAVCWGREAEAGPRAVVAHTVKGKGVSFMEGQAAWHGKRIEPDHYQTAKAELREGC